MIRKISKTCNDFILILGGRKLKKTLLTVLFIIFVMIFVGCHSIKEEMSILDTITQISISNSKGYGGLNENYFVSLDNSEVVLSFEEILKDAKNVKGSYNRLNPDYDILVQYKNGDTHGLHLFLGNEDEESEFMYIGHEDTIYKVNPEGTRKLRQIIK